MKIKSQWPHALLEWLLLQPLKLGDDLIINPKAEFSVALDKPENDIQQKFSTALISIGLPGRLAKPDDDPIANNTENLPNETSIELEVNDLPSQTNESAGLYVRSETAKLPNRYDHNSEIMIYSAPTLSDVLAIRLGPTNPIPTSLNFQNSKSQPPLSQDSIAPDWIPWVRIHSSCLTGDLIQSLRCDCGDQLSAALTIIAKKGGWLIYLPDEGRGIGLGNKIRAYHLQDQGADTYEANQLLGLPLDQRDYFPAISILRDLNITKLNLLTNNPAKLKALKTAGFSVTRKPLLSKANQHNQNYLKIKGTKGGHLA